MNSVIPSVAQRSRAVTQPAKPVRPGFQTPTPELEGVNTGSLDFLPAMLRIAMQAGARDDNCGRRTGTARVTATGMSPARETRALPKSS